ncbi:unnamed protein product, partial [marine sediment metagenome]
MLTSRDRVIRTLNHETVDCAPRDLWPAPGVQMLQADKLQEINSRFPGDIENPDFEYPPGERTKGRRREKGEYTDAWGCTWQVPKRGSIGLPKDPPLADLAQLATYRPPFEVLEKAGLSRVNQSCAKSSRFVLARSDTRPFERLQLLRGTDAALADLAKGTKQVRSLLAMLHDFFCREIQMWADTDVDGVAFMDDWGSQSSLLVPRRVWRKLFAPMYRDYCQILHEHDKFAFFQR